MEKIEHLGIAVKSLAESIPIFEKLLNTECYKTEIVASENVKTAFLKIGGSKIELLESTDANGVIAKFISKNGEGVHHIALEVMNIDEEISRLTRSGFIVLNEPKKGADNKLICFLHLKSTNGILIELCQEIE